MLLTLMLFSTCVIAKNEKNLPPQLTMETQDYFLCKEHTIKYAYVIKIAYVGLYLKDCESQQNILDIEDKLLRFNYQVNVKANVFIEAAEEFFIKNDDKTSNQQEINELNQFNHFYTNIEASEYFDLYHKQGETLKLYKNAELLGISELKSFTYKYFNIWFGKYPAVKPLKQSFFNS
jgi:hypothetical protein